MPMIVANNLNALGINRNLSINNRNLSTSLRNLSTGYKINTGSDDPSGLVISEQLRAQNAGLERAVQNTQETSNVLGIAEGALNEVNNILKKMRQLAVHSANNGVTSAEQVAADQAELDSSIQTIDRIARTTKFSDQFLLNGNKAIGTDSYTSIRGTQNNSLVDMEMTTINQVPANGSGISINFNGTDAADGAAIGEASMVNEARKAYFEIDGNDSRLDTANNTLSQDQFFTLSGNKGSRLLSFATGTSFGEMVETINSVSDSTGADADLIFNSAQTVDMIAYKTTAVVTAEALQTDVGGGIVPTFAQTAAVQGGSASANINNADVTERFDFEITQNAAGQLTIEMIDDDGRSAGSSTVNLAAQAATGDYTQTINPINLGGGTFIPQFDFNYSYETTGSTFNTVASTVIFNCNEDGDAGSVASNGEQYVSYSGNRDLVGALPAGNVTIGNNDKVGQSFTVRSDMAANGNVTFNVTDNSGQISQNIGVNLNADVEATLGISDANVTLNFGANGSQIDFTYNFESDPDNPSPTENTASQAILSVNGETDVATILGAVTTGPASSSVTAPYQAEDASQNHDVNINIFDVVNGETPLEVFAESADNTDSITFVVNGASSGELVRETVSLAALATAGTGSQAISLESPNGTTIKFDYFYENSPYASTYDKPTGKLFEFTSEQVDKDPVFNGLSETATAAGASFEFNLDPNDPNRLSNLEYGRNTDGQGRLFVKVTEHDTASHAIKFELYKDEKMSSSDLVGSGTGLADGSQISIHQANNSNLAGEVSFDDASGAVNFLEQFADNTYLGVGGIQGTNGVSYSNGFELNADEAGKYNQSDTIISGIDLGENTDKNGQLFIRTVQDGANQGQVFVYKSEEMKDSDLVGKSGLSQSLTAGSGVIINEANNSGLGMIVTTGTVDWDGSAGQIYNGKLSFTNLGVRVSAEEYGSKEFLSIQQEEGQVWEYYSPGDSSEGKIVTAEEGRVKLSGADAKVTINGQSKTCDGLSLDLATIELSGHIEFDAGKVGSTTLAQVGYNEGSIFSNAKYLEDTSDGWTDTNGDGKRDPDEIDDFKAGSHLTNAGHVTAQKIDFFGGMQIQLGEGASSNNRTVLGLNSITAVDLGKIRFGDDDTILSVNDLLSGGLASLGSDPIKSLEIIDAAINDVTNMRADIGAWQSNLLETNVNSLTVAIENITKTESYIRDADMAKESTLFSKNQIMLQASTSMLAQANQMNQNILSLIG